MALPVATGSLISAVTINNLASSNALFSRDTGTSGSTFILTFNGSTANQYDISALTVGQVCNFQAANSSAAGAQVEIVGATTLGPYDIVTSGGAKISAGQIAANDMVSLMWNGSKFFLISCSPCFVGVVATMSAATASITGSGSGGATAAVIFGTSPDPIANTLIHPTSGDASKFTATRAGVWMVSANILGLNTTDAWNCTVYKNGSAASPTIQVLANSVAAASAILQFPISLAVGDYVQIYFTAVGTTTTTIYGSGSYTGCSFYFLGNL